MSRYNIHLQVIEKKNLHKPFSETIQKTLLIKWSEVERKEGNECLHLPSTELATELIIDNSHMYKLEN